MAAWTAGILLALGLVWFVAAVVVPVWQTRRLIHEVYSAENGPQDSVDALGGGERAARTLSLYLLLRNEPYACRRHAIRVLGCCGKAAVPTLVREFSGPEKGLRRDVAYSLGNIGADASEVVSMLEAALADGDDNVRFAAAKALSQIDPNVQTAIPVLLEALRSKDFVYRMTACMSLGRVGKASDAILAALDRALLDGDEDVRFAAASALKKIRGEEPPK